ncbi:MAG TPA: AarF/UbiB family protein [Haliangiales bacterium]|nr:AarF/UbiB family protein [Haliangiales bacterium]
MRHVRFALRFLVMWGIGAWFSLVYLVGRIGTLFVRGREERRRAVAHLRGRVLRRAMTALGATFVKLGQVMSTRPDLFDPEMIDELRQLQDRLPPFPGEAAAGLIERQLGAPLASRFAEFDAAPVAAASVAQVHRARLAAELGGDEVAVKVLRPDVRAKVRRDSAILLTLARVANLHPRWRLSDPVGHLRHFVDGILDQTDLRLEVANYQAFGEHFAGFPGVKFPRVYPELSGERVMTMEFLRGTKLDHLGPGNHRDIAKLLQRIMLKMCFDDGFVHADLHPGNILYTADRQVAIFDVGLVKRLPEDVLLTFIDFSKCLTMGTPKDFVEHLKRFHAYVKDPDFEAMERDVAELLRRFRGKAFADMEMGQLMNDVFALARTYRVRPLTELTLVLVGLVTSEGLGKRLNPDTNIFGDIAAYLGPILAKRGLLLAP